MFSVFFRVDLENISKHFAYTDDIGTHLDYVCCIVELLTGIMYLSIYFHIYDVMWHMFDIHKPELK